MIDKKIWKIKWLFTISVNHTNMKSEKKYSVSVDVEHFPIQGCPDFIKHRLGNGNMEVVIANYGCTVVSVTVPDRDGNMENLVAGFSNPQDYFTDHPYFGCVVGRYANRIAFGKFELMGREYSLPINNGLNHLHGGVNGFNRKFWDVIDVINNGENMAVSFAYISPDGEEGYPGNLNVTVTYQLTIDNQLIIRYNATTDQPTIVNLTNHSYFNLSGFKNPDVYDHLLRINSSSYTEKNSNNIPTGNLLPVDDSPFDFINFKPLGKDIHLLKEDKGYDINFVLNGHSKEVLLAAELYEPDAGRLIKVFTNKPGLQVYTANWWDGTLSGSQGTAYQQHGAVALETQSFPDAPNHPDFPGTVLLPGEVYETETRYQFLTR